ncbi:hypothetical protein WICPIJ_000967 [Wickerhamomyces pijperi]|uniref:Uncharacterized protein n=1 Tax=Wickerhamomyces pijperi TaxID=599730 RepID=A0A9P8QCH3_WICPI|nr:hypothetical protein WICPIJ_000967 [Wickerhamomyces pijperi]
MSRRGAPIIANKEDGTFKEALTLFDSKQYKKSLKLAEQILKKNSNYSDAYSLKALNLYNLKEYEESEIYAQKAIIKGDKLPVTNHILGILRRQQGNHKQAADFFKAALEHGSTNNSIWRDLAIMQLQNRDYKYVIQSRHAFLESAMGYRQNWTSLSVAYYINEDYDAAVKTLIKIEDLVKDKIETEAEIIEDSEVYLFKLQALAKTDATAALKELEGIKTLDVTGALELKANCYMQLEQFDKAQKTYRELLKRNPDNYQYYRYLEAALGSSDKSAKLRLGLYDKLAKFYPRSDPPKFIPLTFLKAQDPEFEPRMRSYVLAQLKRSVPATFQNVKPFYKDSAKVAIIEKIVLQYLAGLENSPLEFVWTHYFLSLHYLRLGKLSEALKYVDAAIKHTPTIVEFYLLKARVLKHFGDLTQSCEVINFGRELDLQDRFVNTKTAKYYNRANQVDKALATVSMFTKNDSSPNGLKDLHTMQASWFIIENGEAFLRTYKETKDAKFLGLALKRFLGIVKIYEEFWTDQMDFHTFCMRKGTCRAYINLLEWEDTIYSSAMYKRALKGAVDAYFIILNEKLNEVEETYVKLNKKEKVAKMKQTEQDKIAYQAYTDDEDFYGHKLVDVLDPLGQLQIKFFNHLFTQSPDSILANEIQFQLQFEIGKKVALVLSALNKIVKADPKNVNIPYYVLSLKNQTKFTDSLSKKLIEKTLEKYELSDPNTLIDSYVTGGDFKSVLGLINVHNLDIPGLQLKPKIMELLGHLEPFEQSELLQLIK